MPMPLYVDLDGTLIRGDTMQQAFLMLLRRHPLAAIRATLLLARKNRPAAKELIARHVDLEPRHFPWRQPVLDYVRQAKNEGRRVVLATGTWHRYAEAVAALHPELFDAVYGTDSTVNLIGPNKLARMRQDAGDQPFEYLGDSHADVAIFHQSAVAGWVGSKNLNYVATDTTQLHRLETHPDDSLVDTLKLTRPAWWPLELLVWLPPLMTGAHGHTAPIEQAFLASLSTLLISAGGYVFDSMLAIDADRADAGRRSRELARGVVTIKRAAIVAAVLVVLGLVATLLGAPTARRPLVVFLLLTVFTAFIPREQRVGRALMFVALLILRLVIGKTLLR